MAVGANANHYSPHSQGMPLDDGTQSSEGSGSIHSPIFVGAPFPATHGDNNHHLNNIQHAAGLLVTDLGYDPPTILSVQQPPLLDPSIDVSKSDLRHHSVSYSSELPISSRSHLTLDYTLPSISNIPSVPSSSSQTNFAFQTSSTRRLPGEQTNDDTNYSEPRPSSSSMATQSDHRTADRTDLSPSTSTSSSRPQRREISTVVIACRQCRARKIRCDSTRPTCHNCSRRQNECQYDTVPKRRGPDKRPGTRQRSCKKRPTDGSAPPPSKRKRSTPNDRPAESSLTALKTKEDTSPKRSPPIQPRPANPIEDGRSLSQSLHPPPLQVAAPRNTRGAMSLYPSSVRYSSDSFLAGSVDTSTSRSEHYEAEEKMFALPSSPSVEYRQKLWWDDLLRTYSPTKEQSLKDIIADLQCLFSNTSYWLSFVNPFFIQSLQNDERLRIQPSFILAGLALATLMKSSETELGSGGRARAIWLRDAAQAALETSWSSQWINATLAEAALILALFESSAHPDHTPERETSSLVLLDNIIRTLPLTYLDADDPDASKFAPGSVPVVHNGYVNAVSPSNKDSSGSRGGSSHHDRDRKCACLPMNTTISPDHFTSYWSHPLPWDSAWSASEVRKEECRRLCWSALSLVASYSSQCALLNREPPDFFLSDPANFALLFPGEVMDRSSPSTSLSRYRSPQSQSQPMQTLSPKESIWALYCRSMLLWNFCARLRKDTYRESDKAEIALEAWVETQAIQDSLDMHVCNLNTALTYMAREYIYNTRMTITQALRSLQGLVSGPSPWPVFNRKQAEEWLYYQDQVIKRVKMSVPHLGNPQGYLLTRRPFQVTWFTNQLAICLSLWERDHSLLNALELAKSILIPVDVLNALWRCPLHQSRCDELRERLANACTTVGLPLPLPPGLSLPPLLRAR